MAQTKFTNIEHFYFFLCQILTTFNKMAIMSEPLRRHDHRNFRRECSSCFTCGIRSVTNSQNLVNRLNWVKGSIVISKLLHVFVTEYFFHHKYYIVHRFGSNYHVVYYVRADTTTTSQIRWFTRWLQIHQTSV